MLIFYSTRSFITRKKSFLLDLKLVLITIIAIVFPEFSSRVLIIPNIIEDVPHIKGFLNKLIFNKEVFIVKIF